MQNGPVHDISLLYYGGSHRATRWTEEELQANVTYTDPAGKENWLLILSCFWKHIQERVAILKMAWAD